MGHDDQAKSDLDVARAVIGLEIDGLHMLRDNLAASFSNSVSLLFETNGRIIATGMGKSGHIARKIASTLSSTGAPSHFVHPGEASHGDLGMIAKDDIVLAISNSGETPELSDLLAYCGRFSIPVVAITSGSNSSLEKFASQTIILPDAVEACGETRAPTTSTTMSLAVGDAIAVALLRRKGFTATDFHGFHPGGNLGAALKRVKDLMHDSDVLPLCTLDSSLASAVGIMTNSGFGCVGIVDEQGILIGMLTDGDLRRHFNHLHDSNSVTDFMTTEPKTVTPETLAGDALGILSRSKITSMFVVAQKKPIGLLHVHDCLAVGVL